MLKKTNLKWHTNDLSLVENYDKALKSEEMYVLHHRLETYFSDGTPRPSSGFLSQRELMALDMYYNRPPEELIFMEIKEHSKLHHKSRKGKKLKVKHVGKKKLHVYWNNYISECTKLFKTKRKYHKCSEETRKKISEANKGKKHEPMPESLRLKLSNRNSKAVLCNELDIVFKNSKEAALYLNNGVLSASIAAHIREVCRGIRKTACGYTWKFKE